MAKIRSVVFTYPLRLFFFEKLTNLWYILFSRYIIIDVGKIACHVQAIIVLRYLCKMPV